MTVDVKTASSNFEQSGKHLLRHRTKECATLLAAIEEALGTDDDPNGALSNDTVIELGLILESIREISRKLSKVSSAPLIYNAVRTTGTDSDRHRNFEDLDSRLDDNPTKNFPPKVSKAITCGRTQLLFFSSWRFAVKITNFIAILALVVAFYFGSLEKGFISSFYTRIPKLSSIHHVPFPASFPSLSSSPPALSDHDIHKLELALQWNRRGVQATASHDRPEALQAFEAAIDDTTDILSRIPENEATSRHLVEQNLAIMLANQAGAKLMDGNIIDAHSALHDAQVSEKFNPHLKSAYYYQAEAYNRLADKSSALKILTSALRRADLQDDGILVDALIDIVTDHHGFALDETTFKSWLARLRADSETNSLQIWDLKGEWQRRIDAHLAKVTKNPKSNAESQDAPASHSNPPHYSSSSSPVTSDASFEISDDDWHKATLAVAKNDRGTEAFTSKDRKQALDYFTQAIDDMLDVLSRSPDVQRIRQNLAMAYANRANAFLMDALVEDAEAGLLDAEKAEESDPTLNFGYWYQAVAHDRAQRPSKAMDALVRALRRNDLEDDTLLVDGLIQLYTKHKGFSDDEVTFNSWLSTITVEDEESKWRLWGLKGGWKKRIDEHLDKWKR